MIFLTILKFFIYLPFPLAIFDIYCFKSSVNGTVFIRQQQLLNS